MSVVDETRKLLQDLVSPDLQAIKAELKSVDRESKLRDEALSAKIDHFDEKSRQRDEALSAKIDYIDEKSKLRDEALAAKIDSRFDLLSAKIDALAGALNLHGRVEAIERKVAGPQLLPAG